MKTVDEMIKEELDLLKYAIEQHSNTVDMNLFTMLSPTFVEKLEKIELELNILRQCWAMMECKCTKKQICPKCEAKGIIDGKIKF
jgi:hypothetical protein